MGAQYLDDEQLSVAVVGGGPAGLMAAEVLARQGLKVEVFESQPSVGRKFLMAGKGGMNITHSEPSSAFLMRYGVRAEWLAPYLSSFGAQSIRDWMLDLGVESFVGSSGRVFPTGMKAAPLLRAWLHRLRGLGVVFHVRHRWLDWCGTQHRFACAEGEIERRFAAVVLALGGASWPQLGSDGRWVDIFAGHGVSPVPLLPANCGFARDWTPYFQSRFVGEAIKTVVATVGTQQQGGEFNITEQGVEGGLIYAFSAALRDAYLSGAPAILTLDLLPDRSLAWVEQALWQPRGRDSLANHLRRRLGLTGVKAALLRECLHAEVFQDMGRLAQGIKALPLSVGAPRPLAEAISTAGGVRIEDLDQRLMLRAHPGIFCAGEMLDWEAPTGGYLLTASFSLGAAAGRGVLDFLGGA